MRLQNKITTIERQVSHENCPHSAVWPPPKTVTTQGEVFQLLPGQHGSQLRKRTRGLSSVFEVEPDSIRCVRCCWWSKVEC